MTLADVKDYIKTFGIAEHYYIGKLDNKQDKSIGIYPLRRNSPPVTSLGQSSTYDIKGVSILVHWNKNAVETEKTALKLFEQLRKTKNIQINNTMIYFALLKVSEPVDVGTDDSGVYERVIEIEFYYRKED